MAHRPKTPRPARRHRGFTLIEAMLILVIMSVVALGAGIGLQSLARTPNGNEVALATDNAIVDRMEALRATDFAALADRIHAAVSVHTDLAGVLIRIVKPNPPPQVP